MKISLTNMNANKLLMSVQGFKEFCSDEQAMTSDHNSSELKIHDHISERSSSKLVLKVIPPTDKTTRSRQELELLFSPMYEEYFNAGNPSLSKSSALSL
ncbi:hypothetical protein Tco_1513178 [Tanacetum coccineum]